MARAARHLKSGKLVEGGPDQFLPGSFGHRRELVIEVTDHHLIERLDPCMTWTP